MAASFYDYNAAHSSTSLQYIKTFLSGPLLRATSPRLRRALIRRFSRHPVARRNTYILYAVPRERATYCRTCCLTTRSLASRKFLTQSLRPPVFYSEQRNSALTLRDQPYSGCLIRLPRTHIHVWRDRMLHPCRQLIETVPHPAQIFPCNAFLL